MDLRPWPLLISSAKSAEATPTDSSAKFCGGRIKALGVDPPFLTADLRPRCEGVGGSINS